MNVLVDALRRWWLRLRFYFFRARYDREMEEEMRHHLELRAAELAHEGMSEAEARDAALRRFGNRAILQEGRRSAVRLAWLETLGQDARYVLRSLRGSPGFTTMVVLTLGLGIGANAAMFGVIDRLLLRGPEHVVDPHRVVRVYFTGRSDGGQEQTRSMVPYALYREMRNVRAFERVAAYTWGEATTRRGAEARRLMIARVTWDYFPLLGVRPALGRFFGEEEDRPPQGKDVIVLADGYWRRVFNADSSAVGRTLEINGVRYQIVGVAPDGFTGGVPSDAWVPVSARAWHTHPEWPTTWDAYWLNVIGRLKPGVTTAQANAEATALHRRMYTGRPHHAIARARLSMRPLRFDHLGREPGQVAVSRWLMGVAAVVLLVTCANAGNLALARTLRRRREIAVRLALGISRARLVRLLLTETIALSLAGGAAGLLLAAAGGGFIRGVLAPGVEWETTPIDGRLLVLTAAAALASGLLVGLAPALQGSRPDLATALKAGAREGGGRRSRLRTTLTVVQAALSVVLLVGAGLFVRSLWNVRSLQLGVEPDRVLLADIASALPDSGEMAASDEDRAMRVRDIYARALARVREIPGVEAASLAFGIPFRSTQSFHLDVPGWDSLPKLPGGGMHPYASSVSEDYFRTVGTRLLRGRLFTRDDADVAVVNETMARTLWPGREPIGQCLLVFGGPRCSYVIGVVEDTRRSQLVGEEVAMQYYVPLPRGSEVNGATLLVRTAGPPAALADTVRRDLQGLHPAMGYVSVQPLHEMVDWQVRPWHLGATMFVVFGGLTLVVAAIGLYSLIAYLVAQRTHELGVRIALGARAPDIIRLVMGSGIGAAATGLAIGVALALVLGRFVEPLLFQTSPRDPGVFSVVTATLLTFAVLASLVPTWRATRVDPSVALRVEA